MPATVRSQAGAPEGLARTRPPVRRARAPTPRAAPPRQPAEAAGPRGPIPRGRMVLPRRCATEPPRRWQAPVRAAAAMAVETGPPLGPSEPVEHPSPQQAAAQSAAAERRWLRLPVRPRQPSLPALHPDAHAAAGGAARGRVAQAAVPRHRAAEAGPGAAPLGSPARPRGPGGRAPAPPSSARHWEGRASERSGRCPAPAARAATATTHRACAGRAALRRAGASALAATP